jgi:hypothetical protein
MKSAFIGPALIGSRPSDAAHRSRHAEDEPPVRRRRPHVAAAAAVVVALVVGFGVGKANAADPQLDQALLALEKAEALVNNTSAEGAPEKVQRRFERHTRRAVDQIVQTMAEIDAAKDAYDNP